MASVTLRVVFCLVCLLGLGGVMSSAAAQDAPPSWLSTVIWAPSLQEAGDSLSEHLNQIDAACTVNVDVVQTTNGAGPEGAVYAFLVTWSCPMNPNPGSSGLAWQSAIVWQPTLEASAAALADQLNQTDASCRVLVEDIQSTNGAGPEGPVYAFLIAWAC
jgi:hypothetical protein